MNVSEHMTASQFAAAKHQLPEGGRWHELHEGKPVCLQAPDDAHGNAVLNLSKALAQWFSGRSTDEVGYACYDIGLAVQQDPGTVYCPAICYFRTGRQFEETDKTVADQVPQLVVDIASSNDRRRDMRQRTLAYIKLGVQTIWVPDPMKKEVQVISKGAHTLALGGHQYLESPRVLPKFRIKVADIFAQPKWWRPGV